jgi:heme A synthase
MTQHHIRKLAGWGPIRRAIARLHEPRIISAIYGAVYTIALLVGVYNFFDPPRTIVEAADNPWLLWIALAAMTLGGILGVITVTTGRYWLERYAATLLAGGLTIYWLIGAWLAIFSGGSRILSLFTTTLAIVCVLLRFYWINDRPYNPRHRRT